MAITETESPGGRWRLRDVLAGAGLFLATAAVVLWQNTHVGALWDISYVLDSAARIAKGQMPYRDFPLAHAPLTFLIQAALIWLTGRVYIYHALYAAVVGGLGTVLAWRILLHVLRGQLAAAWPIALVLTAPLTVLGIYCVLPFPSYDCDCTFSILVAVWLLLRVEAAGTWWGFVTGAALCVPLFFKQNIGLPFLAAACGVVLLALGAALLNRKGQRLRALLAVAGGVVTALGVAALLVHFTVGIGNYIYWTIGFAAERRLPGLQDMIGVYRDPQLLWTLPCVLVGLVLLRAPWGGLRWVRIVAVAMLAAPFVFALFSLMLYEDADERGDALLALWPLLLILAGGLAVFNLWKFRGELSLRGLLPVVILVAINGALMSQQLWGSTYAIWPLLVILVAEMMGFLAGASEVQFSGAKALGFSRGPTRGLKPPPPSDSKMGSVDTELVLALAAVVSVTLLVCGGFYIASEERLSYAQFPEGAAEHSAFPQLAGMATPGAYLTDFDELLRFAAGNIPATDGVLLIPGEDPFYFVTGRTPKFPVLLFDPATDPYSPAQVVDQVREHQIRWLIVKRELQIKEDPTPQREATMRALMDEFELAARLRGYDVYRW